MSRTENDAKVRNLASTMESHCKSAGLMDTDYAKAILRIKVQGFKASVAGLKLTAGADASLKEEALSLALAAFKRAKAYVENPDSDGDTGEHWDMLEMERAVNALNSIG